MYEKKARSYIIFVSRIFSRSALSLSDKSSSGVGLTSRSILSLMDSLMAIVGVMNGKGGDDASRYKAPSVCFGLVPEGPREALASSSTSTTFAAPLSCSTSPVRKIYGTKRKSLTALTVSVFPFFFSFSLASLSTTMAFAAPLSCTTSPVRMIYGTKRRSLTALTFSSFPFNFFFLVLTFCSGFPFE